MLPKKDREFASLHNAGRVRAEKGLEDERAGFPAKQVDQCILTGRLLLGGTWMEPACPLGLPWASFPGQVVIGHGGTV